MTEPSLVMRKLRVLQTIGDAARSTGLVGGQAIDLQAAGQAPGHRHHARRRRAARDACAKDRRADSRRGRQRRRSWAAATTIAVDAIDRYAADLGLAFQIVDDILDVEGSAGELGKTVGKDASDAKPTYPALFGLERSRSLAAECVDRARHTLEDARLTDGWLSAIADWVVSRKN